MSNRSLDHRTTKSACGHGLTFRSDYSKGGLPEASLPPFNEYGKQLPSWQHATQESRVARSLAPLKAEEI